MDALAALATKQARFALYPSQWAARSAIDYYYARPEKVRAIPFGANFEQKPTSEIADHRRKTGQCHLLSISTNWERKGGPIAFETLLQVEEMGKNRESKEGRWL